MRQIGMLIVVLVVLFAAIGLCVFVVIPFFQSGGGSVDTRPVAGDASKFDPVSALPDVSAYAGKDAQLLEINAQYVRSDGTMDLNASYNPNVTYEFAVPTAAPADAPPVGAGGTTNGKWYQPVNIEVYQPGQWRNVQTGGGSYYSYMNKGMEREPSDATASKQSIVPAPQCSFRDLWQVALKQDAPKDAVATISYDESGYHLSISDTSVSLFFGMDCQPQS